MSLLILHCVFIHLVCLSSIKKDFYKCFSVKQEAGKPSRVVEAHGAIYFSRKDLAYSVGCVYTDKRVLSANLSSNG